MTASKFNLIALRHRTLMNMQPAKYRELCHEYGITATTQTPFYDLLKLDFNDDDATRYTQLIEGTPEFLDLQTRQAIASGAAKCGCKIIGEGTLAFPFQTRYCASHDPEREDASERDTSKPFPLASQLEPAGPAPTITPAEALAIVNDIRALMFKDQSFDDTPDMIDQNNELTGETLEYIEGVFHDYKLLPRNREVYRDITFASDATGDAITTAFEMPPPEIDAARALLGVCECILQLSPVEENKLYPISIPGGLINRFLAARDHARKLL